MSSRRTAENKLIIFRGVKAKKGKVYISKEALRLALTPRFVKFATEPLKTKPVFCKLQQKYMVL